MIRQNKRLIGIVLAVPLLLLIPLIAMLFTGEVKWTLLDFIVAARAIRFYLSTRIINAASG